MKRVSPEPVYASLSSSQIVPWLAYKDVYLAYESMFYWVL